MTAAITPLVGTPMRRVEDPRILLGDSEYFDDVDVDGLLSVVFVRSTIAHARLTHVDTSGAVSMPGVVGVFTNEDLGFDPFLVIASNPPAVARPVLAKDVVRFVGEAIVAVVAETPAQAVDAAEMVVVDYDPLPVVVDPEAAAATGAPLLFPEHGSNVVTEVPFGGDEDPLAGADVVVRARLVNHRMAPLPMEANGIVVAPQPDGRLKLWVPTQNPFAVRDTMAAVAGIDRAQLHVLVPPNMGGGFGAKVSMPVEYLVVTRIVQQLGRPVKWTETRSENLVAMTHARGQVHHVELGLTRDGVITGLRVRLLQDVGAYPGVGGNLPSLTRLMGQGVYKIPRIQFDITTVATNTTPIGAFRGAGRPEATELLERIVDIAADELGVDPVELRRRNFLAKEDFPLTTVTGAKYDTGDYHRALDQACRVAGYDDLRADQRARRARGDTKLLGIGVASYVEVSAPVGPTDWASVEIQSDGSAVVRVGTSPHGQGHETAFSQIAHDVLGIPVEQIRLVHSDTDLVLRGRGTGGSRSLQIGGTAIHKASEAVLARAKELAAQLLEASSDDIVLFEGARLGVAGAPASALGWAELAIAGEDPARRPMNWEFGLVAALDYDQGGGTFPFGTHLAVVEIDSETGHVELLRHVAVDDCGNVVNPMLVRGQLHGGIANGIGQAMYEEIVYDDDGNPLTANLMDYAMPSAAELPGFEIEPTVTPTHMNPLGAKGVGESGTLGATPAVHNAVVDALSHLGVRDVRMPFGAQRIWRAIRDAS